MTALIIPTRRVVLAALKSAPEVTALVAADEIYPQTTPEDHGWPFGRWDGPSSIPLNAACVRGAEISFMVHWFAKPRYEAKQMVETAEDHCARILAAASIVLSGNRFTVGGRAFRTRVTSELLRRDGDEADAFHGTLNCIARVLA